MSAMTWPDLAIVWLFLVGLCSLTLIVYGLWNAACRLFDVLLNHSATEIDL
jgi:hypothetical protein